MNHEIPKFIILTGLSGAGKSQALKCFEDLDFFCIDNLPIKLLDKFCELYKQSEGQLKRIVIVIDLRDINFIPLIDESLEKLKQFNINYQIIFLEADKQELIRRYNETRRKHPLAKKISIEEGIKKEIEILSKIKEKADITINTTELNLQDLKNTLSSIFLQSDKNINLNISVISFGYKYGIPQNIDLLFDVRFLPNPFYIEELSNKTGLDKLVRDYIFNFDTTTIFLEKLKDFLNFLIEQYVKEGKSYLAIGVGCTGGKHRSVMISLEIKKIISESYLKANMHLFHRDIYK